LRRYNVDAHMEGKDVKETLAEMQVGGGGHSQGPTPVHFSAQLKRILWDMGAFRGRVRGV
jgi:hypothetical protein